MSERLFLVDGYALIYRAFFAMLSRPLTTSRGENTSVPWGIVNFLLRLRERHAPGYVAWVHDAGTTFRHEQLPEYKATREKLDAELQQDFDQSVRRVEDLLAAYQARLVVVDLNHENVRLARQYGVSAMIGDATRTEILEHAGLHRAALVARWRVAKKYCRWPIAGCGLQSPRSLRRVDFFSAIFEIKKDRIVHHIANLFHYSLPAIIYSFLRQIPNRLLGGPE